MTASSFDLDAFLYGGPEQPAGVELIDPRANWGRLTPLGIKLDAAYPGVPLRFDMAVVGAAVVFLPNLSADALSVTIQVQAQPIRWTVDGTAPTAAIGFRADPGAFITIGTRPALQAAQFIREGGADSTLAIVQWS